MPNVDADIGRTPGKETVRGSAQREGHVLGSGDDAGRSTQDHDLVAARIQNVTKPFRHREAPDPQVEAFKTTGAVHANASYWQRAGGPWTVQPGRRKIGSGALPARTHSNADQPPLFPAAGSHTHGTMTLKHLSSHSRRLALAVTAVVTMLATTFAAAASPTVPEAGASSGTISGYICLDANSSGACKLSTPQEPLLGGVTVTAYDGANAVASTTSSSFGYWALNVPGPVRVELTGYPSQLAEPVAGGARGVLFFADGGQSNLNVALHDPGDWCQTSPQALQTCFYGATSKTALPPSADLLRYSDGNPTTVNAYPAVTTHADAKVTGAIGGIAQHRQSGWVFAAPTLKKFVDHPDQNINSMYIYKPGQNWYVAAEGVSGMSGAPDRATGPAGTSWERDESVPYYVNELGFGDIYVDSTDEHLYAIDQQNERLLRWDITWNGNVNSRPTLSGFRYFNVPVPSSATASTWEVGGIGEFAGKIFVGGSRKNNPAIYITQFNPDSETWEGYPVAQNITSGSTLRGCVVILNGYSANGRPRNQECPQSAKQWNAWQTTNALSASTLVAPNSGQPHFNLQQQPQAYVASIDFDTHGDMYIGVRDRWHDVAGGFRQGSTITYTYTYPVYNGENPDTWPYSTNNWPGGTCSSSHGSWKTTGGFANTCGQISVNAKPHYDPGASGGEVYVAGRTSSGWTIEHNGSIPNQTGQGADTSDGFGGGEFIQDIWRSGFFGIHYETSQGNVVANNRSGYALHDAIDPVDSAGSHDFPTIAYSAGTVKTSDLNGADLGVNRTVGSMRDAGFTTDTGRIGGTDPGWAHLKKGQWGKSNGFGDLILLCEGAPSVVGDHVFWDVNANGVRDATYTDSAGVLHNEPEPGLGGETIRLGTPGDAGTAQTIASSGKYLFQNEARPSTDNVITIDADSLSPLNTDSVFQGLRPTTADVGSDLADSDAVLDENGDAVIEFRHGTLGQNNRTHTFGFVNDPPVAEDDYEQYATGVPARTFNVIDNDVDLNNNWAPKALAITDVTPVFAGAVVSDESDITFAPTPGFGEGSGTQYFRGPGPSPIDFAEISYTICDKEPFNFCDDATLNLATANALALNAPSATDDTFTIYSDDGATSLDVGANDTDPDDPNIADNGTFTLVSAIPAAAGTVSPGGPGGVFTYTPDPAYTGSFTFTYELRDESYLTDTATVTVNVTDPVAVISGNVFEDDNFNDIRDGSDAGSGSVAVDFIHESGFTVASTTTDASGNYSVTLNLPADGSIPGGRGARGSVAFTAPAGYGFVAQDVGADDTIDSDVDPATGSTGQITFTPGPYEISAGLRLGPPEPRNDTYNIQPGGAWHIQDVVNNDRGTIDPTTVQIVAGLERTDGVTDPAIVGEIAAIHPVTGAIYYRAPDDDDAGTASDHSIRYTYEVCNGTGAAAECETARVTIRIRPDAKNDQAHAFPSNVITIDVLANDGRVGLAQNRLAITITSAPDAAQGSVTIIDPDGAGTGTPPVVEFTPTAGFTGTTFEYEVCEVSGSGVSRGRCDTATVTVSPGASPKHPT